MVEGKLLPHTVLLNMESVNYLGELDLSKSFTKALILGSLALLIWISTSVVLNFNH